MKYLIDRKTLKSVYYAMFKPHLSYSSIFWAQNLNSIKRFFVLEKKSLRIIYFRSRNAHTPLLFIESNILEFPKKISLENCLFINKIFNKFLPTIFKNSFTLSSDFHTHSTCWSNLGSLIVPLHNTKLYGRNSVNISAI